MVGNGWCGVETLLPNRNHQEDGAAYGADFRCNFTVMVDGSSRGGDPQASLFMKHSASQSGGTARSIEALLFRDDSRHQFRTSST